MTNFKRNALATAVLLSSLPTGAAFAACEEVSASVSAHVTAGRAEVRNQTCFGTFCYGGTYYSVGGDDNLGTSSFATKSLFSQQTGIWNEGTCPVVTGPSLSIDAVTENQVEDKSYETIIIGSVTDPNDEVLGVEFRYPTVDGWSDWRTTLFNSADKSFNTGGIVGHGPALPSGNHAIELRPILGENVYGDVTTENFDIANHAPVCGADEVHTVYAASAPEVYGLVRVNVVAWDQDGNLDMNNLPDVRLAGLGKAWEKTVSGWGLIADLTDTAGELTLGQDYVVEARAFETDGTSYACDDFVFTQQDTVAPYLVTTNEVTINLGDNFDALAQVIEKHDDYSATENIHVEVAGSTVDVNTVGEYQVHFLARDEAGNEYDTAGWIDVIVVDPNANQAPEVESLSVTHDNGMIVVQGTASDADNNLDYTEVMFNNDGNWRLVTQYGADGWMYQIANTEFSTGMHRVIVRVVDTQGAVSEEVFADFLVEHGAACVEDTLANHTLDGRVYEQYYSYYATGSAEYLGSTFNNANTVVALEETSEGVWASTTSCQ